MAEALAVLIVDDEEELVTTLVERLEMRGITAAGASTGAEALELVTRRSFDVVVLDVKLKGEDGVEVMGRLRALRQDLPVILLTGHMSPEATEDGLRAGAVDYLIKPVNLDQLITRMEEAVATARG